MLPKSLLVIVVLAGSLLAIAPGGAALQAPDSLSGVGAQTTRSAVHAASEDDAPDATTSKHAKAAESAGETQDSEHDQEHSATDEGEDASNAHELELDPATQARIGLEVTTVESATMQPEIRAIGVIEEDPSRSFTVRAPIAGVLQCDAGGWPAIGATLGDHAVLGGVQPRLTPLEQFGLANQYVEARAALAEIEADLAAAQASYESKRSLNADGKKVSDRQFEEAEARLVASRARLAGAQQKLALLEQQHDALKAGLAPLPLRTEHGGQVVDVLAQPGEAVEGGQALLRIANFERLIARIELPLGESWNAPESSARVALAGAEDHVASAKTIGRAPRAGVRTRGQSWLLTIDGASGMAPAAPVLAFLPIGGEPLKGVLIPSSAIVRYGGLTWVFVHGAGDAFERRAVQLHSPRADGWFVTDGLEAGTTIVVRGAQVLLSEQLKAQIEAEAEAAE